MLSRKVLKENLNRKWGCVAITTMTTNKGTIILFSSMTDITNAPHLL